MKCNVMYKNISPWAERWMGKGDGTNDGIYEKEMRIPLWHCEDGASECVLLSSRWAVRLSFYRRTGLGFFYVCFMCNVLIVIVAYKSIVWSNAFRQRRNGCYRMWMWTVIMNTKCIVANWQLLNNISFNLLLNVKRNERSQRRCPYKLYGLYI